MEELTYTYKYPHQAVATDCVIFGFDGMRLQVLLIERGVEPYKGKWAFPGGFVRMTETVDDGAKRELMEETGLKPDHIEQFHCFSDPGRDPRERVISIAFPALVRTAEVRGGRRRSPGALVRPGRSAASGVRPREHPANGDRQAPRADPLPAHRLRTPAR